MKFHLMQQITKLMKLLVVYFFYHFIVYKGFM